jgi:hypothetical protein
MAEERQAQRSPEKQQEKQGKSNEQRIADLELQLAQQRAGTPLGTLPDHGAGPDQEIRETWSQADQEASYAGEWEEPEPKERER